MIIDVHTHIFPDEIRFNREKFFKGEPEFKSIYENSNAKMVTAEELIAVMDENQVDKAVVFGFPWNTVEFASLNNDYIIDVVKKYPDRLIGFSCINPLIFNAEKEVERCLANGLKGVGEIAFYLNDIDEAVIKGLKGVMNLCRESNAVFMLHTNEPVGHEYPGKADMKLKGIYNFIKSYQSNKIILAHMGGGIFFYKIMKKEVDSVLSNVYYDTAAVPFLYKKEFYNLAKAFNIEDKILFGSDYPLISPARYFKEMEQAVEDKSFLNKIKGGNAQLLFEIKQMT